MRRKDRPLNWEGAVKVLSAHNMDVAVACYAIQCEGLQELYDYIFSGWSKVTKTDMEDIKSLMKREDIEEEVHYIYMYSCNCFLVGIMILCMYHQKHMSCQR